MTVEGLRTAWALLWESDPDRIRAWLVGFGVWAPLASTALQTASSLIPVLPGFVLAIANAMIYGAVLGGALTFSSALLAGACCFGLARALGRPGVERIVSTESLARVDAFMERRGMLAVFLGRLIPFINPDIVSYAAGATAIRWGPLSRCDGRGGASGNSVLFRRGGRGLGAVGRGRAHGDARRPRSARDPVAVPTPDSMACAPDVPSRRRSFGLQVAAVGRARRTPDRGP